LTNIFDIYETIIWITDKYRNGYLSPEDVSKALDNAQLDLYNYFLPLKENGDDIATTALIPFKRSTTIVSNSTGALTYPADFGNTEAIYTEIDGVFTSIITVLHVELMNAMNSALYPIVQNPRFIEENNVIQIYPKTAHTIDFHYLSIPSTPVIGYTLVGSVITYDPGTSTQIEFDPQYWLQIMLRAMPYIGVNLTDQDVTALFQLTNNANIPVQP